MTEVTKNVTEVAKNMTEVTKNVTEVAKKCLRMKIVLKVTKSLLYLFFSHCLLQPSMVFMTICGLNMAFYDLLRPLWSYIAFHGKI